MHVCLHVSRASFPTSKGSLYQPPANLKLLCLHFVNCTHYVGRPQCLLQVLLHRLKKKKKKDREDKSMPSFYFIANVQILKSG